MNRDPALAWEGATAEHWRRQWDLPRLVMLPETTSTNDVARTLAAAGAPAGLLVMAEHQSAGRGRMGRRWTAAPGDSLLLSFLLRPATAPVEAAPGSAPVRVGIAVATALHAATGIAARLKWPNDVVVPGAGKLAGVLCEAATAGGDTVLIAGIGINVMQEAHDWPDELHGIATSVALVTQRGRPDRAAIMDALCHAMRPLFELPLQPLAAEELSAYDRLDALRGHVVAANGTESARGTASGLAPDGALLIDTPAGVRRITSATVRAAGPNAPSTRSQR